MTLWELSDALSARYFSNIAACRLYDIMMFHVTHTTRYIYATAGFTVSQRSSTHASRLARAAGSRERHSGSSGTCFHASSKGLLR